MAKIQTGQTVHLTGGDTGTVERIYNAGGGLHQYHVQISGELHWVGAEVISELRCAQQQNPTCHYCGMPAVDWDGFNAPVCQDCR